MFRNDWLRLSTLLFAVLVGSNQTLATSEANLFESGHKLFETGQYDEAEKKFREVLDKFPASMSARKSQWLLALSLQNQKKYKDSLEVLKKYIGAQSQSEDSFRGRILLGNAYFHLKRYHEALTTALEVHSKRLPTDLHMDALLLKAKSYDGLGKAVDAKRALSAFQNQLKAPYDSPTWKAKGWNAEILLKLSDCARFPSKGTDNEGQVRDQITRRGICLKEMAATCVKLFGTNQTLWIQDGTLHVIQGLKDFTQACLSPAPPKGKRSKGQLETYLKELKQVLEKDCLQTLEEVETMFSSVDKKRESFSILSSELAKLKKTLGKDAQSR